MKISALAAAALVGVAVATPGAARSAESGGGQDATFVRNASEAGMAEVRFAQLALRSSKTPQIVAFATRMRDDHTRANGQLMSLARAGGFPLSKVLSASDNGQLQGMQALHGKSFDTRYLATQLQTHQQAISLYSGEIAHGRNHNLVIFAQSQLPIIQAHLNAAQRDVAGMDGNAAAMSAH